MQPAAKIDKLLDESSHHQQTTRESERMKEDRDIQPSKDGDVYYMDKLLM